MNTSTWRPVDASFISSHHWYYWPCSHCVPSMLWHCCLKSIRPVKIEWWGVGVVICLEWSAGCLHMVQLMPLHPKTPSSLASFKSRLVLPFWYRLTQVVLAKRLLNRCSSTSSCWHSNAEQGLWNCLVSICLSVSSIYRPLQQHAAGLLLWAPPAGSIDRCLRSTSAAGTTAVYILINSSTAVSTKCEQCYVSSHRRRLVIIWTMYCRGDITCLTWARIFLRCGFLKDSLIKK